MKNRKILVVLLLAVWSSMLIASKSTTSDTARLSPIDKANLLNAVSMFDQGRHAFRFETFDDQTFWVTR